MPPSHTERLDLKLTLQALKARWGKPVLFQGTDALPPPPLPLSTGYPSLDLLLGDGVPRRTITEFLGRPTCGSTTVAYSLMAVTQEEGEVAVYVDFARTFDIFQAERLGVDIEQLQVLRPPGIEAGLIAIEDLVKGQQVGLIVVNNTQSLMKARQGASLIPRGLRRLMLPLAGGNTALVFLTLSAHTPPEATALSRYATHRLLFQGQKLRRVDGDVTNFEAMVTLIKSNYQEGHYIPVRIPL